MTAPFTPEQENRIREIAREEAVRVVIAASKVQAGHAACQLIDRYRVMPDELTASLSGGVRLEL